MAIPEAAVPPFAPPLKGSYESAREVLQHSLDELYKSAQILSLQATNVEGIVTQDEIDTLQAQIDVINAQIITIQADILALSTVPGVNIARRGLIGTIGDPESFFLKGQPFFWEDRRGSGKGDALHVAVYDGSIFSWNIMFRWGGV